MIPVFHATPKGVLVPPTLAASLARPLRTLALAKKPSAPPPFLRHNPSHALPCMCPLPPVPGGGPSRLVPQPQVSHEVSWCGHILRTRKPGSYLPGSEWPGPPRPCPSGALSGGPCHCSPASASCRPWHPPPWPGSAFAAPGTSPADAQSRSEAPVPRGRGIPPSPPRHPAGSPGALAQAGRPLTA